MGRAHPRHRSDPSTRDPVRIEAPFTRSHEVDDVGYPRQGDDEDDPAPIPESMRASLVQPRSYPPPPKHRLLAWVMLGLGCLGVAFGLFLPGTHTEVLLGALLLVIGLRVLLSRRS